MKTADNKLVFAYLTSGIQIKEINACTWLALLKLMKIQVWNMILDSDNVKKYSEIKLPDVLWISSLMYRATFLNHCLLSLTCQK